MGRRARGRIRGAERHLPASDLATAPIDRLVDAVAAGALLTPAAEALRPGR